MFNIKSPYGAVEEQMPRMPNLKFVLDRMALDGMAGWIMDLDQPENAITLTVTLDGMVATHLDADQSRLDVKSQGYGSERCGFSLAWSPTWVSKHGVLAIRVGDQEVWTGKTSELSLPARSNQLPLSVMSIGDSQAVIASEEPLGHLNLSVSFQFGGKEVCRYRLCDLGRQSSFYKLDPSGLSATFDLKPFLVDAQDGILAVVCGSTLLASTKCPCYEYAGSVDYISDRIIAGWVMRTGNQSENAHVNLELRSIDGLNKVKVKSDCDVGVFYESEARHALEFGFVINKSSIPPGTYVIFADDRKVFLDLAIECT